jgi:hypothetical protein
MGIEHKMLPGRGGVKPIPFSADSVAMEPDSAVTGSVISLVSFSEGSDIIVSVLEWNTLVDSPPDRLSFLGDRMNGEWIGSEKPLYEVPQVQLES